MTSPNQPNQGAPHQSPRYSTSIDDVMGQQASAGHVSPSSSGAALPPPVTTADVPPTPGGEWQTAAEVNKRTPRKRSFSGDAPMWFGFGLLICLWGGILMFDHYGPTTDLDARVTEVDVSRSSKGGTSYSIEGVDSQGGEFDTDVSKQIYQRADRGDSVVVSRAWLTGRVVNIDGGGWRHDGGRLIWMYNLAAVLGLVLLVCGMVSMRRYAAADESHPRPLRRVRGWLIVGAVVAAGWIVYERTQASAGDGAAAPTVVTESTAKPARGSVECDDLTVTMAGMVPTLTARGSVNGAQFDQVVDVVSAFQPECSTASLQTALCEALRQAAAADSSLSVITDGRCPGILP